MIGIPELGRAFTQVRANAGAPGADGQSVATFGANKESEIALLAAQIAGNTYRPLPLLQIGLPREDRAPRLIAIPTVRDRVVQTACASVLGEILDPRFSEASFAYRPERGVRNAVERIVGARDRGLRAVVEADIESFFDSIDHARLRTLIGTTAEVPPLVATLIGGWLRNEVIDTQTGLRFCLTRGVPQGSAISPLLANLYLHEFDTTLETARMFATRFADDLIVQCASQLDAEAAFVLVQTSLEKIGLRLHPGKSGVTGFEHGFRFLGVRFEGDEAWVPWSWVPGRRSPAPAAAAEPKSALPIISTAPDGTRASPQSEIEAAGRSAAVQHAGLEDEVPPSHGHEPLLRTLYLMEHGVTLATETERLLVTRGGETLLAVPSERIDQVMVFGNARLTTPALRLCLKRGVPIMILSGRGRYYGVIDNLDSAPLELLRAQFSRFDAPDFRLVLSQAAIAAKIANSRRLLYRYARHRALDFSVVLDELDAAASRAATAATQDELRGIEGAAARRYFGALSSLVGAEWGFAGRVRRPPTDPVNSLLSYGYTLAFYNVYSLLRARGLNPHLGFFHAVRAGTPSLASDMVEEFRAPVVDAVVLSILSKGMLDPGDFILPTTPGEPCKMSDSARKRFVQAIEVKLNSRVTHPKTGIQLDYRRMIDHQVLQLVAVLRGSQIEYLPFTLR